MSPDSRQICSLPFQYQPVLPVLRYLLHVMRYT